MTKPLLPAALLLLGSTPAWAQPITIANHATLPILALNTYPLDSDGAPIEDNLGGLDAELPPGASATFEVTADQCGPLYIQIELPAARQVTSTIDTCKTHALQFND